MTLALHIETVPGLDERAPSRPTSCRNGHPLVEEGVDYWVVESGHRKGQVRCRHCHVSHRPHVERPCAMCGSPFSGSKSRYCDECRNGSSQASRDGVATTRRQHTRACSRCGERKPMQEFLNLAVGKAVRGTQLYRDYCDSCTDEDDVVLPPDSPYEVARREIEHRFGIPAREWINDRDHPLHRLHFCRMLSINNAGAGKVKVRVDRNVFDTVRAFREAVAAGFRPVSHAAVA